ncbi:MAG: sugar phosphate isomerase/epimerase [Clostridia bacterium]|nr:sugar phosphate isomerase/epimerase [Clostridia bacterium]
MKFGGMLLRPWNSPEDWAKQALDMGYTAVYFPVDHTAPQKEIDAYVEASKAAGLTIAEVGVWNNTLDTNLHQRELAIAHAIRQLELADYVGANCCVNIAGSYNPTQWDGHHPDNLTQRAFDEIVEVSQRIVDAVNPKRTAYTLEPMPWMYPDSAESCLKLIQAIDRKGFAAHLDMVNVISSPALFYRNGVLIEEWFETLGPYIRSCHAKDIVLGNTLTVHLDECRPGLGALDYVTYLKCIDQLDDHVTLMLEHMTEEEDYIEATAYLKALATDIGVSL